jgi:hypothetical protein
VTWIDLQAGDKTRLSGSDPKVYTVFTFGSPQRNSKPSDISQPTPNNQELAFASIHLKKNTVPQAVEL